ncbi:MAG TPA: hypothetical protein VK879_11085 [Candidatus Sulfomarinibacteraceae bacterium]|nr:hypothetical protein [Candidatus Sulfomarinibacteraceae bacterium]
MVAISVVLLLSLLLYLPPYKNAFVGDDYLHLSYISPFLEDPLQALQVFHPLWTTWYYRPLQNFWILLNRLLFGLKPVPYYYLLALWHTLAVCAVYALARRLGLRRAGALLATTLFAINAQHHDVAAWISSIATIMTTLFSLLAVAAYISYLKMAERGSATDWRALGAAILLTVMAMFSHEEGLLLPPLLLFARHALYRRLPLPRGEMAAGSLLFVLMAVLGAVHFARPNSTISLQSQTALAWLSYLLPPAVGNYVVSVTGFWLLLNKTVAGLWLLQLARQSTIVELMLAAVVVALLIRWYRRGAGAVKFGLAWAVLHLGFLYLTVWKQIPELYAGRHLYSSWAALSLALGVPAANFVAARPAGRAREHRLRLALTGIALVLALNSLLIGSAQRTWQQRTVEVAGVARQMRQLLPQAPAQAQMFAHRFVLQPGFVAAAAAVWYEQPQISGGSLQRLKEQGYATPTTYLWDYEDGRLYNAIPDFQNHPLTIPLWQPTDTSIIGSSGDPSDTGAYTLHSAVGPPGERRLGVVVRPPETGWLSLAYEESVPENGVFIVDVWASAGAAIRLRIDGASGQTETIATLLITEEDARRWQSLATSLPAYSGKPVTVHVDVQSPSRDDVSLSVPRFVVPHSDKR